MTEKMTSEDLTNSALSVMDEVGVVFVSVNKVLRGIRQAYVPHALELLKTGLIDELVQKGLFPETEISDSKFPGYPLVLEHKKISPIIYPYEWSPEMLRRAAFCVLEVNQRANVYGYELKDAHPYNVVFNYCEAQYVDFGSFAKRKAPSSWVAREEFVNCYYRVLQLAEKGLTNLFKHAFLISGRGFSGGEMKVALSPVYSLLGARVTNKLLKFVAIYRMGPTLAEESFRRRFPNPLVRSLACHLLKSTHLPFRKADYSALKRKIRAIKFTSDSEWGDYHSRTGHYAQDGSVILTDRMQWVVDVVKNLAPATILELAGNQGILSRALSKLPGVQHVICADYDEKSIDQLLIRVGNTEKVYPACFDFMAVGQEHLQNGRTERFKSDMVIALAVMHHLVLTQGYAIESILKTLSSYTKKYLIIEFMPLGLWDGISAPPVPGWYDEPWFVEHISEHFKIMNRTKLEDNRVVFVCEVLTRRS